LADAREGVRLNPSSGNNYENLAVSYFFANRLDEARVTIEEAWSKQLDTPFLHLLEYNLAFLRSDAAGMAQQIAWVTGKRGIEDVFLSAQADTAAYSGQLRKADELSRRAAPPPNMQGRKKRQRATKLQLRCEKRSSATQPKPVSALLLCSNFPKAGMWSTKELWRWP